MKFAYVVSLPKVKLPPPKRLKKDLRPIFLTPLVSKIQESFVVKWIWDNVGVNVDPTKYGCKRGSSTLHALVEL